MNEINVRMTDAVQKIITPPDVERPSEEEARDAVRTLLRWAGDDPDREGLLETPDRVIRAYREWFAGYGQDRVTDFADLDFVAAVNFLDDRHVLFRGGVGDAFLHQGHILVTADEGPGAGMNHFDHVAADLAFINLQFFGCHIVRLLSGS